MAPEGHENLCTCYASIRLKLIYSLSASDPAKKIYQTDIAIANPTNQTIIFPPTSSVVIGVNGIMPGVPGG